MKILRLDLEAFGPFTDEAIDLEAGSEGLHIIYGPNEAGKSSALRAVQQLFFGIPERSSDAFLHPYDRLRIGGRIQHSDGSVLDFFRRKARAKSLQRRDGQPCTQQELARYLGGVEQGLFASMFGITHEVLVAGGAEILRGGGQLGQVLFAAGTGVANLRTIQDRLRQEMEELFKPAGRLQKINKSVAELRELQDVIKKQQLPSEEWERHDRNLRDALEQNEAVVSQLDQKRRQQKHLTRLRDALPVLARRRQLLGELAECRDAVLLPANFSDKRRQTQQELAFAESRARQATTEADQLTAKLATLALDGALLDQAERIEELYRRLGEYRKDVADRPRVELMGKQCQHDAKEILRSLGQPPELDQAEKLRLPPHEPIAIAELGQRHERLRANSDNLAQQLSALQHHLERCRKEIGELATPRDLEELRLLSVRARQEAGQERELAELQNQLQKAESQAALELNRLPLWKGNLAQLLSTATPGAETVDRFDTELKQIAVRVQNLERQIQEKDSEIVELENRARQLELEQNVPSEDDLQQARQHRETGWQLIRGVWLDKKENRSAISEFTAGRGDLPESYERSVQQADQLSDRLRREADRVARKAAIQGQREKLVQQRKQSAAALDKATAEQRSSLEQWQATWAPLDVTPQSPQEMRAWLRKHAELIRLGQACHDMRERADRLHKHLADLRSHLATALAQAVGSTRALPSLQQYLEHIDRVVQQNDELSARRRQLQRDLEEREQDERRLRSAHAQAETELSTWRTQWASHMERLGMAAEATPAQASAVLARISELFHKLHEADGFRRRIEGIDRDMQQFAADVHSLADRIASDLADAKPEPAVEQLYQRLKGARAIAQDHAALTEQRRKLLARAGEAQQVILQKSALLQTLCAEVGCASPSELPAAEERSNRRRQLEENLRQLDEQLQPLLGGCTLEAFLAEVAQIDPDALDGDLDRLAEECQRLEKNKEQLMQAVGAERNELERMDGNGTAAESAELAENLLAGIENDAQQYIRLRLAAGVLQKGIERYRERNQGPVLSRAGSIFAELTLGSFEGLQVDYNDKDEAILTGVRSGQTVPVEGMSDGARDQLYLALRIASLEAYLTSHEPVPFIVDDILLNFDDDRSLAALRVLADLARKTQIIFFTHHQHLVELARTHLDSSVLFVHQLGGSRVENGVLF